MFKKKYFKFIEIDKALVAEFLGQHPNMKKFINPNIPFYVRVGLKPYPTLIHAVICQDANNLQIASIANALTQAVGTIKPRKINKLSEEQLFRITRNPIKAILIQQITKDVLSKKLDLKKLVKQDTQSIINALSYDSLSINTKKQFALFSCFKQDVLCIEDPDFITGLKIYLNKKDITKQDIINISNEYKQQLTLFSLCMWRIVNERNK